jgi:hypothetical protein
MFIAPSRVDSADGRIETSRSKTSLLAGRVDYRQVAGRTTAGLGRRAITDADGGGGVDVETKQQLQGPLRVAKAVVLEGRWHQRLFENAPAF